MQDEINRIRGKDLSTLDEQLFENMSRAQNLDGTLNHLSQLQKFLIKQIKQIGDKDQSTKNQQCQQKIQLINKGCQSLKSSVLRYSCRNKIDTKQQIKIILTKVLQSKQNYGTFKSIISKQLKNTQMEINGVRKCVEKYIQHTEQIEQEKYKISQELNIIKQKYAQAINTGKCQEKTQQCQQSNRMTNISIINNTHQSSLITHNDYILTQNQQKNKKYDKTNILTQRAHSYQNIPIKQTQCYHLRSAVQLQNKSSPQVPKILRRQSTDIYRRSNDIQNHIYKLSSNCHRNLGFRHQRSNHEVGIKQIINTNLKTIKVDNLVMKDKIVKQPVSSKKKLKIFSMF